MRTDGRTSESQKLQAPMSKKKRRDRKKRELAQGLRVQAFIEGILAPEIAKRFSELIVELPESGKVGTIRPWVKAKAPRLYFQDGSHIGLGLTGAFTHSGEGTLAHKALTAIGYPSGAINQSVYVTRRTSVS